MGRRRRGSRTGAGGRVGTLLAGCVALAVVGALPGAFAGAVSDATPRIAWTEMRNPVLGQGDRATKDPAVVWVNGRWQALFSSVDRLGRWRVGLATSRDLRRWSRVVAMPHEPSVEGEASPDVVRDPDGRWVVTYQSFVHDVGGGEAKLYYRTTTDFQQFSAPRPLGRELHPAETERMIDPALAFTPVGLLLGYKVGGAEGPQAFEVARSATGSLDGPWQLVGRPDIHVYGDTIENYQFLHLHGAWQLLATSNRFDRPFLFALAGSPTDESGWLHWLAGRELMIPQERWNRGHGLTGVTYEHANCAFLVNRGRIGDHYYLVYADAADTTRFGGAGYARLAVARSTDLVHWTVPPG